jgi:hypothetical protein
MELKKKVSVTLTESPSWMDSSRKAFFTSTSGLRLLVVYTLVNAGVPQRLCGAYARVKTHGSIPSATSTSHCRVSKPVLYAVAE